MRASPAGRGRLPTSTPVLFVIDGDPGAAHALRDDLSRRFGREFRIVCESAADAGLAALGELAVRRVPAALLVVGQDLGGMSGVAFLGRAREMHPQAVRVLLVERDYSARSPIDQAMILGQGTPKPPSTCSASSASTTAPGTNCGELLIRFNVPFRFVTADSGKGRRLLADHGVDDSRLPVLVRYDELRLRRRGVDRTPLPLETSMPGVFAIGDVRYRSIKRVASAVGDGATAIRMIHEYLAAELTGPPVRINRARTRALARSGSGRRAPSRWSRSWSSTPGHRSPGAPFRRPHRIPGRTAPRRVRGLGAAGRRMSPRWPARRRRRLRLSSSRTLGTGRRWRWRGCRGCGGSGCPGGGTASGLRGSRRRCRRCPARCRWASSARRGPRGWIAG